MSLVVHILSVAVLLGGLIFFHELGHFLVAKAFRVKVLKFSLGFGPRLVGFTWGETEYRLSLLPLGGYVKMAGDDPAATVEPQDQGRGFLEQSPWRRMAIAFAGPAFNLIFPVIAYFLVFAAQTEAVAPQIGQLIPGMPAEQAGLQPGDRIVSIEGERIYAFQDLRRFVDPNAGKPLQVVIDRSGSEVTYTLTPAPFLEQDPIETIEVGKIGIIPNLAAPMVGIEAGGLAEEAGLRSFDRIESIGGKEPGSIGEALELFAERMRVGAPFEVLASRKGAPEVPAGEEALEQLPAEQIRATITPEDERLLGVESAELYVARIKEGTPAAEAGLRRGDRLVSIDGAPLRSWQEVEKVQRESQDRPFELSWISGGEARTTSLAQAALTETDELRGRPVTVYSFGAYGGLPALPAPMVDVPFRPVLAAKMAVASTWEVARKIARGMGMIVTGQIAFKNVGGPLQIYDIATKAADQGWEIFLHTMAMVSINLGLVNLFPVPVLDGGHIVQAGVEAVRRKPLSMRAREITNAVGFVMLMTLMFFAIKNDVVRFFFAG